MLCEDTNFCLSNENRLEEKRFYSVNYLVDILLNNLANKNSKE